MKNPPPPPQNISFEFSSPPDYLSSSLHSSQNSITTVYTDDVDFLLFYAARRSLLLFLSRSRCKNKTVCRRASSRCRSNLLLLHLSLLNDAMHTLHSSASGATADEGEKKKTTTTKLIYFCSSPFSVCFRAPACIHPCISQRPR